MSMNPYEKYKQQSVMTMTQGEMLVKLFEEIVKQLSGAVMYIENNDPQKANVSLQKSQKILNYLKATLNHNYEVSAGLNALYDFFIDQTVKANIKKDPQYVNEIIPMISELGDTFAQAERLARIQ